jgi:hypothetical protein
VLLLARSEYFRNMLHPDAAFRDARALTVPLDGCPFDATVRVRTSVHMHTHLWICCGVSLTPVRASAYAGASDGPVSACRRCGPCCCTYTLAGAMS